MNRDRERNNFINPWASSQTAMSGGGGGGGGGNSNFDGSNFNNNGFGTGGGFGASNQFGNNGLGLGFNNPNSLMSNTGLGSGLNSSFGNNSNMNSNSDFDNNMGANNGPVFGMNSLGGNNLGNNLANNMGNNGSSDEPKETTQVTIPKDVSLSKYYIRKIRVFMIYYFHIFEFSWPVQLLERLALVFDEFAWNQMPSLRSMNRLKDQPIE